MTDLAQKTGTIHITNDNLDCMMLTIFLHNVCNYSCSYCDDSNRNGSHRWPADITPYTELVAKIRERHKYISIDLIGGEPTLWPKFHEMIAAIASPDTAIVITTNASRTLRYWDEFPGGNLVVVLSWHHEECDDDHFVAVATLLQHKVTVCVQLLVLSETFDRAKKLYERLKDLKIDIAAKQVRVNIAKPEYFKYSDEQRQWIINAPVNNAKKIDIDWKIPSQPYFNGTRIKMAAVIDARLHNFDGWECDAGNRRLYVEPDGSVYRCTPRVGGSLGNIFTEYTIPTDSITCTSKSCHCRSEVAVEKWSPIVVKEHYTKNPPFQKIFDNPN